MLNEFINTQSPITKNIGFLFSERETSDASKPSWQNTEILLKFDWITPTIIEGVSSPFEEEIESGIKQEFADRQGQRLVFPSYDEEDILKLDAVTVAPPPRRSGTIRVKLIPKGRSKPIPVEDPWEA